MGSDSLLILVFVLDKCCTILWAIFLTLTLLKKSLHTDHSFSPLNHFFACFSESLNYNMFLSQLSLAMFI